MIGFEVDFVGRGFELQEAQQIPANNGALAVRNDYDPS